MSMLTRSSFFVIKHDGSASDFKLHFVRVGTVSQKLTSLSLYDRSGMTFQDLLHVTGSGMDGTADSQNVYF